MIGRWIDEKCRTNPDIMRRVLGRKFGDLQDFIGDDGKCGCLVGSWELENGHWSGHDPETHFRSEEESDIGYMVHALTLPYRHGVMPRSRIYRHHALNGRKRPDAFVIRLLKQRIRKSLGIHPVEVPGVRESVTV